MCGERPYSAEDGVIRLSRDDVQWSGIRFLDPLCRACSHDGVWYKAILPGAEEAVRALMATGLYDRLAGEGLLAPVQEAEVRIEGFDLVLRQHSEAYDVPARCWPTLQLRDACLAYLRLNEVLAEYGLGCIDGHTGNFVVQGADRPVWCDIGSFVPVGARDVAGLEEFVTSMLYPLLLRVQGPEWETVMRQGVSAGFPRSVLERMTGVSLTLGGTRRDMLRQLADYVQGLRFTWPDGVWGEYHTDDDLAAQPPQAHEDPLRAFAQSSRLEMVNRLVRLVGPRTVVDLGANAGFFSNLAASTGAEVLAVEPDDQAASRYHAVLARRGGDVRVKVRVEGVGDAPGKRGELVMALALTHHLYFTHRYRLPIAARALAEHSEGALLTEFMPNGMGGTVPNPDPLPADYRLETFTDELARYFSRVEVIDYPMPAGHAKRVMVLCTGRLPRAITDTLTPDLGA